MRLAKIARAAARWAPPSFTFMSQDRGLAVRTADGYEALARRRFNDVQGAVLHDTLFVPYTIFTMTCTNG